jgi:hypothetical protein
MTLAKDVKQGEIIRKLFKVDKPVAEDPNDDKSPLIFTITTDVRDRDGDIVDPAGIMVENYANNAVMQWAHKYDDLPVGKSVEMWAQPIKIIKAGKEVTQQGVKAAVEFQPDDNYHESFSGLRGSMVRRMYLTGFLNAVSIGFDPYNWNEIEEKDEERQESPMSSVFGNGTHFTKWDLLEFSAVPVPANPQAVIDRAATFGHDKAMVKAFLKEMSDYCTEEGCAMKRVKSESKSITDTDKSDLLAGIGKENLVDLSAYHRRLHMFAAQGNLMTGFTQADMNWLHAQVEKAMCDLHKKDDPPSKCADPSPLEWKKDVTTNHQLVEKCSHITEVTERIREREENADKKPPKMVAVNVTSGGQTANVSHYQGAAVGETTGDTSAAWEWTTTSPTKEEENVNKEIDDLKKMVEDQQKQINELNETLKAGRVLSAANESDLRDAVTSHNSGVKLTNGVLAQVTGKPGAGPKPAPAGPEPDTPPDDDGKSVTEPVIDVSYPLGHEVAELKDVIPDVPEPVVADEEMIIISEEELDTLIQEAYDEKAKELGLDDELAANAS